MRRDEKRGRLSEILGEKGMTLRGGILTDKKSWKREKMWIFPLKCWENKTIITKRI